MSTKDGLFEASGGSDNMHLLVSSILDVILPSFVNNEIDKVVALRDNGLPNKEQGGFKS